MFHEHRLFQKIGTRPAEFLRHCSGLLPSLAALFELADGAANDEMQHEMSVSLEHTTQAIAFCRYLESHARRVYGCATSPERHAARELGRHLEQGDLAEKFTTRDVYLKGWSGLDTAVRARGALEVLADASWVRLEDTIPSPNGGKPREEWTVNPKVRTHAK